MTGTIIDALVLAVLSDGVDLFGVSACWQGVVTGGVLLIAVVIDQAHRSGLLRGRRVLATNLPPRRPPLPHRPGREEGPDVVCAAAPM